jgi:aerobic carbon-monoxide dehydrogenase large subunit
VTAQMRLEDPPLLTGSSRFTDDINVKDLVHLSYVRSMMAHARIVSIDATEARSVPGVVAVLLASDLGLGQIYLPAFDELLPRAVHRPAVAGETVRFVGEIVAVVVAESVAIGLDAAELVAVEYDPLPVIVDPVDAVSEGAPLLFPSLGTNVALSSPLEGGQRPDGSSVRIQLRLVNHRMAVAPMEGSAITVVPDNEAGRVMVSASTQFPHLLRDTLADAVGLDPADIHLITPAVGGGFGGKMFPDVDYAVAVAAALKSGRSVRWVQQRNENLMTMHARDHVFDAILEATADGRLTSLSVDALSNVGAYPGFGCTMLLGARTTATGPYDIPHISFNLRSVATNTAPTGAFRGAGHPELIDLLERCMDLLADEVGVDPADIRRRNLLRPEQFPYLTPGGSVYDTGDYLRALNEALHLVGYEDLRAEQARRRESGTSLHLGIGLSCYVDKSAAASGYESEYAAVEVDADGLVHLGVGTSAHGQGHRTTFSIILADIMGVPLDCIDFVDGDTDRVARGVGTGGSRSAQLGGSAVKVAGEAVVAKARELAAHLLEASVEDIEVVPAVGLAVRGVPTASLSWGDLAKAALNPSCLPPGMSPGLSAAPGYTGAPSGTAPFGCHVAVVEIDGETGSTELLRIVAVNDCGVVLNPMLAQGQIHGGLAAGIAQALFEAVHYDDDGNIVNATFAEYLMPSAADLPSFETTHTVTPTPRNPLGAKGIGEAGTTGSLAAVHNAVVDAVSHLGVRHIDMPLSPQRIWEAISAVRAR